MGVACGESVTVIDLDHQSVTRTWARPGHHTSGYGMDFGPRTSCREIYTGMKTHTAGEGIRALAEARGNPASIQWSTGNKHIGLNLSIHHQSFENFQLLLAILQLAFQLIDRGKHIGWLVTAGITGLGVAGAAHWHGLAEIEFVRIKICDISDSLTHRIQSHEPRLQHGQAQG